MKKGTYNADIITPTEAARISRLSDRTIRNMCERGDVEAVKVARRWLINRERFYKLIGLNEG